MRNYVVIGRNGGWVTVRFADGSTATVWTGGDGR